jgi:plastocyanin
VATLAAAIAALAPASAGAAVKRVTMGLPAGDQATFNEKHLADVNDFFPHRTIVNVGDRVDFVPTGFHAVDVPAVGASAPSWVAPKTPLVGDVRDAAGARFWFDGGAAHGYLDALSRTLWGRRAVYDGRHSVRTGLPGGPGLKPARVRFTRAGRFTYWCNLHAGMRGVVEVRRRGEAVPTARRDRRRVRRQVARDLAIAKRLPAAHATEPATVDVGVAGAHGVEYFGMYPAKLTVPVGTTVRFRKSAGSFEDHTAAFGPQHPGAKPTSYLGRLSASFQAPVFDPRAYYPSDAPGTVATLTPRLHGNGFWNTGLMDSGPGTPMPDSGSVTFGAPGTYRYHCLLHTFMSGTVVVQPQ